MTATDKLMGTYPVGSITRSHLLVSLNFQGELLFEWAAYHLKEAGFLELSNECLSQTVNLKNNELRSGYLTTPKP